nr:PREDICTED: cytochrome b-c1 complex subunit 8 isoform X2 [Haliaeetus albicilla]
MGLHFGNLARVRHVITYSLSPFEQRAFPNVFSHGLPNIWRRFSSQVFKVVPREYGGRWLKESLCGSLSPVLLGNARV